MTDHDALRKLAEAALTSGHVTPDGRPAPLKLNVDVVLRLLDDLSAREQENADQVAWTVRLREELREVKAWAQQAHDLGSLAAAERDELLARMGLPEVGALVVDVERLRQERYELRILVDANLAEAIERCREERDEARRLNDELEDNYQRVITECQTLQAKIEQLEEALGENWLIDWADDGMPDISLGMSLRHDGELWELRAALTAIVGPSDEGPWMDLYRQAGGGYEGLQAIARAALDRTAKQEQRDRS